MRGRAVRPIRDVRRGKARCGVLGKVNADTEVLRTGLRMRAKNGRREQPADAEWRPGGGTHGGAEGEGDGGALGDSGEGGGAARLAGRSESR